MLKTRPSSATVAIVIASGMLPWLGIAAGAFTANLWALTAIGALLWIFRCLVMWYMHSLPRGEAGIRHPGLATSLLLTTLTFVPLFVATALGARFWFHLR